MALSSQLLVLSETLCPRS